MSVNEKNSKGIKKLVAKLAKEVSVTVGIHGADGAAPKESPVPGHTIETLIDVASAHEYGLGVPQRSFVGGWVDANETDAQKALSAVMKPVAEGHGTQEEAAAKFGLWAAGQMQQRIADGIDPPLTDYTLRQKEKYSGLGKETPLILTGQLRSSIRSKVEIGGGHGGHGEH